jgi:hypothetical protein
MSGISMHYDLQGDHPLIGSSAPDFEFEDGTRLGTLLHNGKGLMLDLTEDKKLHNLAQRWPNRINYASTPVKDSKGLTALLIRPDGFVAWLAESEPNLTTAEQSIQRWFGSGPTG